MADKKNPAVSIIVPVYNVKAFIEETIQCVLAQTFPDWELLLIEDGSTDGTGEFLAEYLRKKPDERIAVYPIANTGAAAARNYGLTLAKGRFITYLDADDLWEPEKLEHQLAFVKKRMRHSVLPAMNLRTKTEKDSVKSCMCRKLLCINRRCRIPPFLPPR